MRVKNEYYRMTEDCLKSINLIEGHIEELEKELNEIRTNDGTKGISYEGEKVGQTFKINKQTENTAINNITREDLVKKQIAIYTQKVEKIKDATSKLSKQEQNVLYLFYTQGKIWFEVTKEQNASQSTCKRIRKNAIKKLAFILYGTESLESFDFIQKII